MRATVSWWPLRLAPRMRLPSAASARASPRPSTSSSASGSIDCPVEGRPGGRLAQLCPRVPPMTSSSSRDSDRANCAAAFHARRKSSIAASSSCSERITSEPRGARRQATAAPATAAVAPHNENLLAMGVGAAPAGKPPGTPARRLVPAKRAGSQNVSATWWPQAQSSASRRVARKKKARFGNAPGAASSRVLSDQATAAPASSHRSRHLKAPSRRQTTAPEGRNMAQPRQTAKPEIVVHQRIPQRTLLRALLLSCF